MRLFALLPLVGLLLLQTPVAQIVEPPIYPEGLMCTPRGTATTDGRIVGPDHPCHCKRMMMAKDCCATPNAPVAEDSHCLQFCHKDHCACPVGCTMHDPDPLPEDQ